MSNILMIHPRNRESKKELFLALSENFDISFLFIARPPEEEKIEDDSTAAEITYNCLDLEDKRILPNDKGPGLGLIGVFQLLFRLSKVLVSTNSKVIITSTENPLHSKIAFFWSRILKKKFLVWTESWEIPDRKGLLLKFLLKLYQKTSGFVLKNADAVLVSGINQKNYCRDIIGILEEKIFIFNNCSVDKAKLPVKKGFKEELGIRDKKIVLFFGRLIKRKGLEILLQAFQQLEKSRNDVFLLVVGEGEYEDYLKKLTKNLKIKNISFLGFVDFHLVPSIYNASDVFCLPSYVYNGRGGEGYGTVLNEAASMGLPIVTTDAVGGAPDLVKNGINGFIVKNGNAEKLNEALKKVLSDDILRKKMGENSRKIFEEFNDFDKVVNNVKSALSFVEK